MKNYIFWVCIFFLLNLCASFARSGSAVTNGNWNSSSTWSFNDVPNCGDTLTVPTGITVSVNSQESYASCSNGLYIVIGGIFQFTNGNKLYLNCNSAVSILAGGVLKKSTPGGGTSTLLSICGSNVWIAADGPIYGAAFFGSTLPVEFLRFEAETSHDKVKLIWSTASETNNDYFILERSNDGKEYKYIASVDGVGNSSITNEYNCIDYFPNEGVSYYRLKQFDFNGHFQYSETIPVLIKEKRTFNLLSIVASNKSMKIKFASENNEACTLKLIDMNGTVAFDLELMAAAGLNSKDVYCPFLKNGIYTMMISNDEEMLSKKVLLVN